MGVLASSLEFLEFFFLFFFPWGRGVTLEGPHTYHFHNHRRKEARKSCAGGPLISHLVAGQKCLGKKKAGDVSRMATQPS